MSNIKHFLVIRDENNKNLEVLEFSSFKEAKDEQKRREDAGHQGQLVLGSGDSKEGFLENFGEYRPN